MVHVEQDFQPLHESSKSMEEVSNIFHSMALDDGLETTYNLFNTKTFRDQYSIPTAIWKELEPAIREKINEIRAKLKANRPPPYKPQSDNVTKSNSEIPAQYPSMRPASNKTVIANLVNSIAGMDIEDEEDTDDDMLHCSAYMVRMAVDPPSDVITVRARLEYAHHPSVNSKVYAISDGGADACVLGRHAKVITFTGRYANLQGYDPENTFTGKVPIVNALLKCKSSSIGELPILLQVNNAPLLKNGQISLISEYQVREYNKIIDSVATKHRSGPNTYGTQRFWVNSDVYIDFEDRGDSWDLRYYQLRKVMRTSMTL